MTPEIRNGQPPQPADAALLKAYHDAVIKQADLYVDLDAMLTVLANGCYRWLGKQWHGFETAAPKQL